MFKKRGQIRLIFTWIFILVLAGMILFFGIKLVKRLNELGGSVQVEKEIDKIEENIEEVYYLDVESSKELQLNFPDSVEEVCFVHDPSYSLAPIVKSNYLPATVIDTLKDDPYKYNFFILGEEGRFLKLEHISGSSSNVCKNGRDKIKLINRGKYVKVE